MRFSVGEWHQHWFGNFGIVVAVFLWDLGESPTCVHENSKTFVPSRLEHLFKNWFVWVLQTWVEVESCEADLLSTNQRIFFSALELNDPIVLATISTLFVVDDGIGVFHLEKNLPPGWWIKDDTCQGSIYFSCVEIVGHNIWLSKAVKSKGVLDLLFSSANICHELLLAADATKFGASWVLSIIVEGKLIVCANKLFHRKLLFNFGILNLKWSWTSSEVEFGTDYLSHK